MGSNQLDLARERLGNDVIIFDHHLIEDDNVRAKFVSSENENKGLCNPHALHKDDEMNAQYCATGLAYRAYQITAEESKEQGRTFNASEKDTNTVAVIACIGTATDMVDVFDLNGYNRQILKDGLQRIDNADEQNLNYVIGNVLARNNINDGVTAHQLAFNVGAYINSASRMSEIAEENGAMRMYNALTADPDKSATYRELDALAEQNGQRKYLISQLTNEDEYLDFIEEHRFGDKTDDNIGVYQLPDNVPAAFAGLVAGKLAEATDKAIICLTYSDERGAYTGSGRNAASNETSLKSFVDNALAKEEAVLGNKSIEINYGGHEDAIGISKLNDFTRFAHLVDECKDDMKAKDMSDKVMLSITPAELTAPETLEKLKALEPTGVGFEVPPTVIKGDELSRDRLFKAKHSDWKTVRIKDTETKSTIDVSDWSYAPEAYPQSGKKGTTVAVTATLGISDYKGEHLELTAKSDRAFLQERLQEVAKEKAKTATKTR
jgi:single-stranded DNA-specific DHH superfamily exonuclease